MSLGFFIAKDRWCHFVIAAMEIVQEWASIGRPFPPDCSKPSDNGFGRVDICDPEGCPSSPYYVRRKSTLLAAAYAGVHQRIRHS